MTRLTGLSRLHGLREQHVETSEHMNELRGRFARLADDNAAPRAFSAHQLFQTPEPLADRIVALATDGRTLGRTLEPSAGLGRLYLAARKVCRESPITLVEIDAGCGGEIARQIALDASRRTTLFVGDFLACDQQLLGEFDTVIMNPPFTVRSDLRHIDHARTFLASSGRLVAICMATEHRMRWADDVGAEWIALPEDSFKSEGTRVSVAIVVLNN